MTEAEKSEGSAEQATKELSEEEEQPKKKQKTSNDAEEDQEGAYAKLYGKCLKTGEIFEAYLKELPCELGRQHSNQPTTNFICLGSSKQISRIHAAIDYDYALGCFTIEPKGKNSITVRKVQYSPKDMNGNKKISLSSRDPIRIGNIGFYFLRSTFEKPKEAYAELARKVFESLPVDTVLGTRNICERIVKSNLYFQANYSAPESFSKLMNSLQQALRRSPVFIRCGNKQRAEWKLETKPDEASADAMDATTA